MVRNSDEPAKSGWGLPLLVLAIGVAAVFGLASIAPEEEHGTETVSATSGTVEHGATVSSLPPEGGAVTTTPPKVGGQVKDGDHEGEGTFELISGQCPGPEEFEEEVVVTTASGTIKVARPEKGESLDGAVTTDGTFYAQAQDGLTRYDGKVGSAGFTAVYRQVVENCLAQYNVKVTF